MIRRVFVANRGEIAVRIIRAAHDLGVEAVAVFSEADAHAKHVRLADVAIGLAGSPREVHLDGTRLAEAAVATGCDAVHPGYGFLSEDAAFATRCADADLVFIGPAPDSMRVAGDKASARRVMAEIGVPVVPGTLDAVASAAEAAREATRIGYPVLLKARAGGGGRGMSLVRSERDIAGAFEVASAEARSAFSDGGLYVERYLPDIRHVEVQVLGDDFGGLVHVGERECTIQRRHQKVLEECPAPSISNETRAALHAAALAAAKAVEYKSAGTVEFIIDNETEEFFFIEMNTRIQVEHPVTEVVTGIDLVAEQFAIADQRPLSFDQDSVRFTGHAIECRITAEDPKRGFLPSPGTITRYMPPGGPGIRVDDFCRPGDEVTTHFDSLIAKVIAHGENRDVAIARMRRALREFDVVGVDTNAVMQDEILSSPQFQTGRFGTGFLSDMGYA